jgi:hypothetical protein
MIFHAILNMQKTKYGEEPIENLVIIRMRQGFKTMCMVYESIASMVHFFIYAIIVGYYSPLPSELLTQGSCLSGFQQSL